MAGNSLARARQPTAAKDPRMPHATNGRLPVQVKTIRKTPLVGLVLFILRLLRDSSSLRFVRRPCLPWCLPSIHSHMSIFDGVTFLSAAMIQSKGRRLIVIWKGIENETLPGQADMTQTIAENKIQTSL